VKLFIEELVAK